MKIFAYGSNLSSRRLRKRVPSATFLGRARLEGYVRRFHKRGADGSAKANVVPAGVTDVVWGAVFECPEDEKPKLDRAEGLGRGYDEELLTVELDGGEVVEAYAYVAYESAIDDSLQPYHWYLAYVIDGAREQGLPDEEMESLRSQPSIQDPVSERAARNAQAG